MKNYNENAISPGGLILADNSWRLRKFRTRTILTEDSGKKVVRKLATTEESHTFLKTIAMRERANAKYLQGHFDVLCGRLKANCIEYEYLPHQSLTQKIQLELKENRVDKADQLLRIYIQKVRALNRLYIHPKEFLSMVSQDTVKNYKLEVDCLSRGLLDLTPRNILMDGDKWILIDNEWSFGFSVPVVFVLFRAITETVAELQDQIRKCTSKTHPAVGIMARNFRTYYFPEEWLKHILNSSISFAQMLKWERGFVRYVSRPQHIGTVDHMRMKPRTKTNFSVWGLRLDSTIGASGRWFLAQVPLARKALYALERLILHLQK